MRFDPLTLLTAVLGLAVLVIFGRYAVTGTLDKDALTLLCTSIGVLIPVLSARRKKQGGDDDDQSDPPAS